MKAHYARPVPVAGVRAAAARTNVDPRIRFMLAEERIATVADQVVTIDVSFVEALLAALSCACLKE